MQMTTSRQFLVRLAGVIAIAIGLVIPGSAAAAWHDGPALNECTQDGCAIVTQADLGKLKHDARVRTPAAVSFPTDQLSPHFVP